MGLGAPGGFGVLVFFVLSGFLITWLLLKEEEQRGDVSLRKFYFRRAFRIFPAFYCFSLSFLVVLLVSGKRIIWGQVVSALLYVSNYYQAVNGDPNTGFSHAWSLGIEEQFYLLWPVTFVLLRGNRARLSKVLAGVIGAVWLHRGLLHCVGVKQGYLYAAFDTRADHLAVGCLLAVLLRTGTFPRFWTRICAGRRYSVLFTLVLVGSLLLEKRFGSPYRDTIGFALHPLLVALLIVQLIALRESILWSWLNWRWVRYLGRISYSVYLYHPLGVDRVWAWLADYPLALRLVAAIAVVVFLASSSYYLVERPFLRLKERYQQREA